MWWNNGDKCKNCFYFDRISVFEGTCYKHIDILEPRPFWKFWGKERYVVVSENSICVYFRIPEKET